MGKRKSKKILAWLLVIMMVISVTLSGVRYGAYASDQAIDSIGGSGDVTATDTDAERNLASDTDAPAETALGLIQTIAIEDEIVGASTSTNLNDFINNVTISAPQNEQGIYMVLANTPYDVRFFFAETSAVQFPDDGAAMTYTIPEGITTDPQSGTFNINVTVGNVSYLVEGNTYELENNTLTVRFNANDSNFNQLTKSARANFNFAIQGSFDGSVSGSDALHFTDIITKGIEIDTSNSVDVSKASSIDYTNGKINYTVTVKSTGNSSNVVVRDTISGDNGVLSLDPGSVSASSSTGQQVALSGGVSGNGFTYSIPSMKNNEIITFRYSANIDASMISNNGGKFEQASQNQIKATSDGDPDGDEETVTTTLDYTPSVSKGNATVGADGKTLTWTVTANPERQVSMSGSQITDTIAVDSQSIMTYSGDGLTVRVVDENNSTVRTDNVPWASLDSKTNSEWAYTVPAGDAGHNYKYEITYTTEVDTSAITTMRTVNNTVSTDGGKSSQGSGKVAPEGGSVELTKTATAVDRDAKEVTWNITFTVPGTNGLSEAVLTDNFPKQWVGNGQVYEPVKAGSIEVTGLVDGESYTTDIQQNKAVITFTKDGNPGLKGTGVTRTVVVTLKTEISDDWVAAAATQSYLVDHNNSVSLKTPDPVPIEKTETVRIAPSKIEKQAKEESKRTVDGVDLPIYKYEIVLQNVDSVENTILDTFDTEILEVYDQPDDAWRVYGGDQYYQGYQGNQKANYLNTANGVEIHTSGASMPKDGDNFYAAYKIVYYLTVKNKAALEKLQRYAVGEENGTYYITNSAEWNGIPSTAEREFKYDALDKEILTSDNDLKKTDAEIWADFRITVNPAGAVMNEGNPMEIVDTISNLSIDITSIEVNPSTDSSWDMSGDVLTITVPDATPLVINYRARVKRNENTQAGSTSSIPISNTAVLKRHGTSEFEKNVSKTAEYTNSGSGSADVPAIGLMKYEAGNMNKKLEGAEFMLLDKDKNPITDKDNKEVTFTTNAQGLITVQGDMAEHGWALDPNEKYYLREVKAPNGYMLSDFDYEFTISEDGTTDYANFLYHSGDVMSAKDVLGADVMIDKTWSDGNGQHDNDVVLVKLQQKIGDDGEFKDTIRYYDAANDDWAEEERTLTLDKNSDWKGAFRGLPATVPPTLPEEPGVDYLYADYRIVEVSVNGTPVMVGSFTVDEEKPATLPGGTYNMHLTNQVEEKTGSLEVSKTVSSPVTDDLTKDFSFTVTLDDDTISGPFGDMEFTNGVATFTLKNGETKAADSLPVGIGYTVEETADNDFATAKTGDTGTISEDATAQASFTNTRKTGSIVINKTFNIPSDVPVLISDKINLVFQVKRGDEVVATCNYYDVYSALSTGQEGYTIGNLPLGTYSVVETNAGEILASYSLVIDEENSTTTRENLVVTQGGRTMAAFTNTYKKNVGGLTVTKTVVSPVTADLTKDFEFTVTLDDDTVNGTYGDMTFTNGVATFTLKNGETKTATGLAKGIGYTVEEAEDSDFAVAKTGDTGTIGDAASTAAFTNTRKTGSLCISKQVTSAISTDESIDFAFTVTLDDTTINGTFGDMTFTNGVANITLKHNETKTATGLPNGVQYTISEEENELFDATAVTGNSVGSIPEDGVAVLNVMNTRKTGDLEVSKTVVSDASADHTREFEFTITLSNTTITGTFGDVEFTNGVATVTLKDGETATIAGLPTGVTYTVVETADNDFVTTKTGETGTIRVAKSTAAFTNTRKTGDLEVSKTVVSDAAADQMRDFEFTVTLDDDTISGTYGDMTFTDGVATFTLKTGETKTATGLPTDVGYTVIETADSDFTTAKTGDTGTISEQASAAEFTNTRKTGDLEVTKSVTSSTQADKNKDFSFTVTLSDTTISGTFGDATFTDGVATFTLKHGETATITGLPTDVTYTVEEAATAGFITTKTGDTGTISETKSTAAFTNTKDEGGLVVSKTVDSPVTADLTKDFEFTVTLDDDTVNGTYGDMTFTNGVATFTLQSGETKSATGLAKGIGYTVTETDDNDFVTSKTNDTGTIGDTASVAAFTNTRKTGDLAISKQVTSAIAADQSIDFAFTVTLDDTTINGTFGDMTFTNGVANITLKHNETKTATGLPDGVQYTISEEENELFDATAVTGNSVGSIPEDNTAVLNVMNTRKTGDLQVAKNVVSDAAADQTKDFAFTVTLDDDTVNGTFGEMTFTDGVATFNLKNGETKTAEDLPVGIGYTVEETADNDFTTTKSGDTGTISEDESAADFTNTRKTGDLDVTKSVTSSTQADQNKNFSFTVTLSDTTISGTYGDATFANGVATFTLKHGETVSIEGLPTGVTYTVAEASADGFVTTKAGDTGTISETKSTAAFTNTKDEGGLLVSKEVVSPVPADQTKDFAFTVTLDDDTVNGTYGDMTFTNGVATFTLQNGETKTATGLAKGIGYTVTETDDSDFETTKTGDTGTIGDEVSVAEFTNTRKTGDLEVTKTVDSPSNPDLTKEFEFTVTLSDTTITGTFGDAAFTNGVATFTLKDGETATVTGLPTGVTYTVAETADNDFVTTKTGETGTISTAKSTAAFTNTRKTGDLKVTKTVTSQVTSDQTKDFEFTVTLDDTTVTGTFGDMTFTDGVATFTLKNGEAKTATGLPGGAGYTVAETANDLFTTTSEDETGTIAANGTVTAAFTNTRNKKKVKISKVDATSEVELPGAHIQILDEDGKVVVEWDSTDVPFETDLTIPGKTYTLRETVAPDGYAITTDTTFTLDDRGEIDKTKTTTKVSDENVLLVEDDMTSVKILKVDVTDQKELPGAHIQILDEDGKVVVEWDSTDKPYEVKGLKTGVTYTLRETVAPKGYQLTTDTKFTLDEYGKVSGDTTKTTTVMSKEGVLLVEDLPEEKVYGSLLIKKQGYINETCSASPDETRALSGVTFALKSVELAEGETPISQTLKTDENGMVLFENLLPGRYEVTETATLEGYILAGTTWYAVVEADGTCKGLTDADGNVIAGNILINDHYRTDLHFKKVNEKHPEEALGGSEYNLFRIMADGTEDFITSGVTDEKGEITFAGVLTGYPYKVQEAKSPAGYFVSSKPLVIGFKVVDDGVGGQKVVIDATLLDDGDSTVMVDEAGNITWLEPPVVVEVSKVDAKDKFVPGAKLRIEDTKGNVVVPEWISGSEAKVIEGQLVIGETYYLVEVAAPDGYAVAAPVKFTISSDSVAANQNLVIKVKMVDEKVTKTATATKTGDRIPLRMFFILMLLSILGMIGTIVLKQKRSRE